MAKKKTKEELRKEQEKKQKEADEQLEASFRAQDTDVLEKSFELLQKTTDMGIESIKTADNKASLLLILFVGIFTIFSCFFEQVDLSNTVGFIIFCSTICSYIVSMIFLILTIANRKINMDVVDSVKPNGKMDYKTWLIKQIVEKNHQIAQRGKVASRKSKFYTIGSIALIISVCLTLIQSVFIICL